ncbi:MAG: PAS domain S-box protein [Deltaproteobacteria bacterium]|nr:PAS domain S-box protein [Deltaproteobacteria bacterium]
MVLFDNLLNSFRRFQAFTVNRMTTSVIEKDDLAFWRVRVLFAVLFTALIFCTFAIAAAILLVMKEQLWGLAIFDVLGYLVCIFLLFSKRLSYEIRASVTLLMFYIVGLVVISYVGPFSGGPLWLFTFAVLVGVLLGSRSAIVAIALNGAALTIFALLFWRGQFGETFQFGITSQGIISAGANFLVLNVIAAMSVSALVKGLVSSHKKEHFLSKSLEQERIQLIEAKKRLEFEVDERKRAEKSLRKGEQKYRSLYNSIRDAILVADTERRIIDCNPAFSALFGYALEEIKGQETLTVYASEEEFKRLGETLKSNIDNPNFLFNVQYRKKSGEVFPGETNVFYLKDDKGAIIGFIGLIRDLTERKVGEENQRNLRDQLYRAQKMEAMGLLAGGVAHDLNNILSGVVSYPELLLMDLPEDSPLKKPIKNIQESGIRAADVVADLLTIARGVATGKEALNFNTIVREYLTSAEFKKLEKAHAFVDFKAQLDSELLNMNGSSIHMKKLLMNLVINATEAIERSGTVTISTRNRYLDEPIRGYENVRQGEYAVLSVSDDGSGISTEDIERIFEPFYTKKVMGRSGTGLGLAVVWNTVQDHNGYINVKSNEKGTLFELYFPVTREEIAEAEEPVDLKDYLGHGEKILVVDDEERQREIACGMLIKLGYNPEAVSSGEEAIAYVKEHPVDLIVLDMIMPKGINGRETYQEIIQVRPGQKAIIASGFAKTREVDAAQDLGAGKYIKKPYMLEKMGLAIRHELEK